MFKVMEDVLDGIKDYLTASLEAELVKIEAARSVTIDRWEIMERYEIMDFGSPAIEILPDTTKPEYGDESTSPVIGDHFNDSAVDIFVSVSGSDTLAVNNTLLRYAEAFSKLIRDDETFGNRFNWVMISNIDYSPMIDADKTGQLMKIMTFSVVVRD